MMYFNIIIKRKHPLFSKEEKIMKTQNIVQIALISTSLFLLASCTATHRNITTQLTPDSSATDTSINSTTESPSASTTSSTSVGASTGASY